MEQLQIQKTNVIKESISQMFELMTSIVETTLITHTNEFTTVTKQVIKNIAALSLNFHFQCINCSWFGTINFVFETSPQKEVHWREVRGTCRVLNNTPSSNPCVWNDLFRDVCEFLVARHQRCLDNRGH